VACPTPPPPDDGDAGEVLGPAGAATTDRQTDRLGGILGAASTGRQGGAGDDGGAAGVTGGEADDQASGHVQAGDSRAVPTTDRQTDSMVDPLARVALEGAEATKDARLGSAETARRPGSSGVVLPL
jgi:hypothetical protein